MKLINSFKQLTKLQSKLILYPGVLLAIVIVSGCSSDPVSTESEQENEVVTNQTVTIQGNLYFPSRHILSFDTNGDIGEIPVAVGDQVAFGQHLMSLDATTKMTLEQKARQAQVNLDSELEKLNLYEATLKNKIAAKRLSLDTATTTYNKLINDHNKKVVDNEKLLATANSTLDTAEKNLNNFEHSQEAKITKAQQTVSKAQQSISAAKLKIETAEDNLTNIDITKAQKIVIAQKTQEAAVLTLQNATDAMQTLKVGWLQTQAPFRDGKFDFDKVDRYQADIDVAEKALDKADSDLANLLDDPEDLDKIDLQNKLTVAENDLETANDDLITAKQNLQNITDGSESLTYQELMVAVKAAEEQVSKYIRDIADLGTNPNELAVNDSQTNLEKLKLELNELIEDPYNSEYELHMASVRLAKQNLADAVADVSKATLTSPADATVYTVNADLDDSINQNSIVMKLVEPKSLIFNGSLEGDYLDDIRVNQKVEVHIPKLQTNPFTGVIQEIKDQPLTKRGIITFPVIVRIDMDTNIVPNLENYNAFVVVKNTP